MKYILFNKTNVENALKSFVLQAFPDYWKKLIEKNPTDFQNLISKPLYSLINEPDNGLPRSIVNSLRSSKNRKGIKESYENQEFHHSNDLIVSLIDRGMKYVNEKIISLPRIKDPDDLLIFITISTQTGAQLGLSQSSISVVHCFTNRIPLPSSDKEHLCKTLLITFHEIGHHLIHQQMSQEKIELTWLHEIGAISFSEMLLCEVTNKTPLAKVAEKVIKAERDNVRFGDVLTAIESSIPIDSNHKVDYMGFRIWFDLFANPNKESYSFIHILNKVFNNLGVDSSLFPFASNQGQIVLYEEKYKMIKTLF